MGSLEELRELNRLRVVEELRRRGHASRGELADATGLSRTTVTTLVADLQERGLVIEAGAAGGRFARGRPPVQLRLDPSAGAAIGVDFGHSHVRVAVADLSATVLGERRVEIDVDGAPGEGARRRRGARARAGGARGADPRRVIGAGDGASRVRSAPRRSCAAGRSWTRRASSPGGSASR